MNRLFHLLVVAGLALSAAAVPANPEPQVSVQPDGTRVTLRLCGDEFYSFSTTIDGYTVLKDHRGAWVYAQNNLFRHRSKKGLVLSSSPMVVLSP